MPRSRRSMTCSCSGATALPCRGLFSPLPYLDVQLHPFPHFRFTVCPCRGRWESHSRSALGCRLFPTTDYPGCARMPTIGLSRYTVCAGGDVASHDPYNTGVTRRVRRRQRQLPACRASEICPSTWRASLCSGNGCSRPGRDFFPSCCVGRRHPRDPALRGGPAPSEDLAERPQYSRRRAGRSSVRDAGVSLLDYCMWSDACC